MKSERIDSRRVEQVGNGEPKLELIVIYTKPGRTAAAIRTAAALAFDLNACIRVIVPQIVPYPLPLDRCPVAEEIIRKRLQTMFQGCGVEASVEISYCRDRDVCVDSVLAKPATVIIGTPHWWPGFEKRLALRLKAAGHQVVTAQC